MLTSLLTRTGFISSGLAVAVRIRGPFVLGVLMLTLGSFLAFSSR